MTMARQQIGSLSGNWDEVEPCRSYISNKASLGEGKAQKARNA